MKRLTSTQALASGFVVILGLLVYSAREAFRFQYAGAQEQSQAYQRFIQLDDAVSALRRTVFMGGIYARDYFLDWDASGRVEFRAHLAELELAAENALRVIRASEPAWEENRQIVASFHSFFQDLRPIEILNPAVADAPSHIIEDVLLPRRLRLLSLLEDLRAHVRRELAVGQTRFQADRAAAARRLVLVLSIAIFFGVIVAVWSLRYALRLERERQRNVEALTLANSELENLSNRLLEIQEQERRSLSQELHDEVGQTLTALRMELSHAITLVREPVSQERLLRARALVERTVAMVRNISLMLRPSLLDDLGLGPALQWQLEQFSNRSGIAYTLEGGELGEQLSDAVKTCVFRIAQEALNNCEKYACAISVNVVLSQQSDRVTLMVRDDGVGFTLDERGLPSRGTGILGMKERAQKQNGTLTVTSHPGEGTTVYLMLPSAPDVDPEAGIATPNIRETVS
ncbi:MAG TPA: sensor histidine kinase [Bryobacteraceae bacterium]|nr:sensor histidine kinase [Bryobacteraceae bacterium]